MLSCGHEKPAFGEPLCSHLRNCRQPRMAYVRRFVGTALDAECLCVECADARDQGRHVDVATVCQECYEFATTEVGDCLGVRGQPEIPTRPEPFSNDLRETAIPKHAGRIVDLAPVLDEKRSVWLLLAECGELLRLDADTGDCTRLGCTNVPAEPDHEPWCGRVLRSRLHASRNGNFAAVVNDYGRYGQVIDLATGRVTLELDGGDYHPETVPFAFAFVERDGLDMAIHRTDWNRLDISDAATGALRSARGPTSYCQGEPRPSHYLDYFHGALHVSPGGSRIVDDGWVWHPVGVPTTWSIDRWLSENVWESEDGPSKQSLSYADYYWDRAICWLDEQRVALGGIGEDERLMVDGVRIFDVTLPEAPGNHPQEGRELRAFAGPARQFFSDGIWLYSSNANGLSRWDYREGVLTGRVPNFQPTYHHRGANEFVELREGVLVRLSTLRTI